MSAGAFGMYTRVDFDVAISAETQGGGKGSLEVFSVGISGGAERKSGYANRINFGVPIRLPDGDNTPSDFSKKIDYPNTGLA